MRRRPVPSLSPRGGWLGRFVRPLVTLLFMLGCAGGAAQAQSLEDANAVDPPGRVGSITLLAGPVTLIDLDTGSREDAALNWPITTGWRLDSGRTGQAEVRIGSTALRLDDETTVDFVRVDDQYVQIAVLRGSVALRLRNRELLGEIEVLTQRERIVFDDIGRYRIDVDRVPGQTSVTAFDGRARIASGDNSFVVAGGQRGDLTAPPMVRFQVSAAFADRFDDWVAERDSRDDALRSRQYVSREATGVDLLDDYGDWRTVDDYGWVWFPRTVAASWAPYRYGRWAWVDPWGWTWIDEAPWGFAPFHYGRWVVVGGFWGWAPGVIVPRPVYAPALVAWFSAPGVSVSIGAPIGWFPLGPREVYVPAFRHSPRYLRVVNVQNVPNVDRVTIVRTPRYVHRHPDRSTWVPGDRFGRPDTAHRDVRPPPSEWRQYIARPQPPVNVPNTKRRQHADVTTTRSNIRPPAAAPAVRPPVRPPRASPRAVEAPRVAPAPPPAAAPRELRQRSPVPDAGAATRRIPEPRAPVPEVRPPSTVTPPALRARPREAMPVPAQPATIEGQGQRPRGELGAPTRDGQRRAPRAPIAPPATAPAQPPSTDRGPAPEPDRPRFAAPQPPPEPGAGRRDETPDRQPLRGPREAWR